MNPLESELIQIPKSHLQSMTARLLGVKNLIRINVAKEDKIQTLKSNCQTMEAKCSNLKELISRKNNQEATCCNLPLPDTYSKTKPVGISEESYYKILEQLCHTRSVLKDLQKTTSRPLMIESWTQTNESAEPTDEVNQLKQTCQALQAKIKEQRLEFESISLQNSNLTKKLSQVLSENKLAQENAKKSAARLKREKELHEKTREKLLEVKAQIKDPVLNKPRFSRCSQQTFSPRIQQDLEVDCDEDIHLPKQCERCHKYFSTDDDYEYHLESCQENETEFK